MSHSIPQPLRVAVLGCGQIADAHLQEITRIQGADVVAVCDINEDIAYQAAARFAIAGMHSSLTTMLTEARPDVVHITIPPHVRKQSVEACLAAGCHVYVEKPVAMNARELGDLYRCADANKRLFCAGHDQLFDPAWLECRRLVAAGTIGEVVHVDALQGYDLSGPFGKLLASDSQHWVCSLPGGTFQNIISHALSRICDVIPDEFHSVAATWDPRRSSSPLPSEVRATMWSDAATATVTFSSAARPVRRLTTVLGTRATLEIDFDARTVRTLSPSSCPTALSKIYLPMVQMRDSVRGFLSNLRSVRGGLGYFAGMNRTFELFYRAIRNHEPAPVSQADAMRVTELMDRIILQCQSVKSLEGRDLMNLVHSTNHALTALALN